MADVRGPSSKIELRVLRGHQTATVREEVVQGRLSEAIGRILHVVREAIDGQGVEPDGAPFVRYHSFGEIVDLEAGVRVTSPVQPAGPVQPSSLPAGPAAIAVHAGPYESLGGTYDAMRDWLEASTSHVAYGGPWELYITDPSVEPDPNKWLTEVIMPLKAAPSRPT